jgi:hypothetical protein
MRRVPIYVFPCRVQQGWGDVVEMGRAVHSLREEGFPLYYLRVRPKERQDPRAIPVDPAKVRWTGFPTVKALDEPVGDGPAVVIATWWGMTARRTDSSGRPVPGVLADSVDRITAAHEASRVLHVSLEEFASAQSSMEASAEALRQAGWQKDHIKEHLSSSEGHNWVARYHDSFLSATAGDREDVLHLVASFSTSPQATREFPFLVQVGPYRMPGPLPHSPIKGAENKVRPKVILWYATDCSSPRFATDLMQALTSVRSPLRVKVRTWQGLTQLFPSPLEGCNVTMAFLGELSNAEWLSQLRNADLLIVGGSQSLVEALSLDRPFLYFNGYFPEDRTPPRAFRREKLSNLLLAWRRAGVSPRVLKDFADFADGRNLSEIVSRALGSLPWRREVVASGFHGRMSPLLTFPPGRADGSRYLLEVVRTFDEGKMNAVEVVRRLRTRTHPHHL